MAFVTSSYSLLLTHLLSMEARLMYSTVGERDHFLSFSTILALYLCFAYCIKVLTFDRSAVVGSAAAKSEQRWMPCVSGLVTSVAVIGWLVGSCGCNSDDHCLGLLVAGGPSVLLDIDAMHIELAAEPPPSAC
ncbi:hypothetical protein GBAR_LOCUS24756 [Geodia barretti]|uniref:Uncharacterized protein n=1 Tax=Geodia barretti TaxID=519541 RepID=A0AA35TBR7_GEOBA|nr:hypothetical protein GBAR_LOCUS24756 [Geodia barretti]